MTECCCTKMKRMKKLSKHWIRFLVSTDYSPVSASFNLRRHLTCGDIGQCTPVHRGKNIKQEKTSHISCATINNQRFILRSKVITEKGFNEKVRQEDGAWGEGKVVLGEEGGKKINQS